LEEEKRMEYISSIERVRSEQRFHEGEQKGKQAGEQGGKTEMLSRLLTRRFGVLPPATQAQIKQATIEQIAAWFDRGMDATTLDEVFQGLAH
jgi:predicted transposase YdaD